VDTLHFERYEYKYFVPEPLTSDVRRFIRPYVVADEHARRAAAGRYTIYNLYLDTPRFDLYDACVGGALDRFKLRIRWYDEAARGPFFFEVKRKIRQVVRKDRARVSFDELAAIARGDVPVLAYGRARDNLAAFLDRVALHGAEPCVLTRYTREAYESVFADYARLTFDRSMAFQPARGWRLPGDPRGWMYTDAARDTEAVRGATMIELKFTRAFPRWMSDLVAEFGLERVGYSKYIASVRATLETAHGLPDFERVAVARFAPAEPRRAPHWRPIYAVAEA